MLKIIIAGLTGLALSSGLAAQQFEDATNAAGVGTTPEFWVVTDFEMLSWMAASLSAADLDGDGWDDMIAFAGDKQPMKLFHNDGDGTFTEQALASGFLAFGQHSQALCGDPDDDGDIDVMLFSYANMLVDVGTQGGGPGTGVPISSMINL